MKSKYKLKIKEISMRLKNGSILLLGILCLFAFASVASATDWTDPTCAAPGCNTEGPVWVNPGGAQTGYASLRYDDALSSTVPIFQINDQRVTVQPTASLYVTSMVEGAPAIQGANTGDNTTSYGGYFSATAAPGLYVTSGVVVEPLASNPTDYEAEGLLYLNSDSNQFRYYGDSAWRILNPFLTADGDSDGIHELYYSVAAGNARGVAIKNSADADLTPNNAYTLDVVRKSQSTSDRTVNGYLQAVGDTTYANGALGAYDGSGNMVGVKGSASGTTGVINYGGYFSSEGLGVGSAGVYGISTSNSANIHYGGDFRASSGGYGVGVNGYGATYGGQFEGSATGSSAIRAVGFGDAASYSILVEEGAIALAPITTLPAGYATLGFMYIDSSDDKLYYQDKDDNKYDLTSGSGTIADGDTDGQMSFWNDTAKEWQNTETNEMVWNDTNKNLVIGTVAPSTTNRLEVMNTGTANNSTGVYGGASTTTDGVTNYGGFFSASSTGAGSTGIGVKGAGNSIGGDFVSTGTGSYALRAETYAGVNNTVGGYFRVQGTGAKGVYGIATASDGIGVQGQSSGTGVTYGVYGNNTGVGNTGAGVYGTNSSSAGYGVEGVATATGVVTNIGGKFTAAGNSGYGVHGMATATGAVANYGVYGEAAGDSGTGVRGIGLYAGGFFSTAGTSSARAVQGSASGTGAITNYGGHFQAAGNTANAVYGRAGATGAYTNYGGYFEAAGDTGRGVYGVSSGSSGIGVYGNVTSATGVNYGGYFIASGTGNTGAGLYAKSFATGDNSYGIYGETLSTAAAIYGNNARTTAGTGGVGVEGVSSAPAGGAGVIGRATDTGAGQVRGGEFYSAGSAGDALYASATGASGRGLYASGLGESARFAGSEVVITDGSDAIGYATGAGDLYVGDALEVDGLGYFGSNIYLGSSGAGATDNYLYFDFGGESLMWDNTNGRFSFSDDLYTTLSIESATTLRAGGIIYSDSNLYLDNDFNSTTDVIYFSTTTATDETLMWDSGTDSRFEFSDDVYTSGNLTVAGNINAIGTGGTVYGNGAGNFGLYSNRTGSDGNLLRFDRDGANVGLITVAAGTITYGTFTGSHYVLLENNNIERGQLIHLTGNNSYKGENNTGEMIYGAKISEMANDPAIIGSYFSVVEDGDGLSWAQAVGNGDMWVVDNGSNLEIGDYLISSDVPGHAMKVTDEYPVAYVVARVAENVDWSKVEEKTEDGIKHKKISIFFESFILNQDLGLAFDKNQNLDDLSWFYAMEAKTPVEKAIQTQKQQLDALETKVEILEKNGDSDLMEYIKQLEARVEALEAEKAEPVKTSFWSKLW